MSFKRVSVALFMSIRHDNGATVSFYLSPNTLSNILLSYPEETHHEERLAQSASPFAKDFVGV